MKKKFVTKILNAPKTTKEVDDKNKKKLCVYMSHTYRKRISEKWNHFASRSFGIASGHYFSY